MNSINVQCKIFRLHYRLSLEMAEKGFFVESYGFFFRLYYILMEFMMQVFFHTQYKGYPKRVGYIPFYSMYLLKKFFKIILFESSCQKH